MSMNDVFQVETCIEKRDLTTLLTLPNILDDFSELSIVKSVECLMMASEREIKKATKDVTTKRIMESIPWQENEEQAPLDDRKCFALNIMLSQKFSIQFLQEAAQEMTFDSALRLIEYLRFLLCWSPMHPSSHHVVPSIDQIIDWLNAIIDSHFQQLNLASDAFPIIDSLYELISTMAKSQTEAQSLKGTLYELCQQFSKQQKDTKIRNYCIEIISF